MKDGIGTDGQIGGRFGAQVMRQVLAGYIISVKSALLLENFGWWVEMPEMQKSIVFCIIILNPKHRFWSKIWSPTGLLPAPTLTRCFVGYSLAKII